MIYRYRRLSVASFVEVVERSGGQGQNRTANAGLHGPLLNCHNCSIKKIAGLTWNGLVRQRHLRPLRRRRLRLVRITHSVNIARHKPITLRALDTLRGPILPFLA
jgi:hypothetical protein